MVKSVRISFLLLVSLWSGAAWGHHAVSSSGIAWVEPVDVLEVELQTARFDFGGARRGFWQSYVARGEWSLGERASVSLRAPWALVRFEDGRTALGLSDLELGARVGLIQTAHGELLVSAGLAVEVPTGEERLELGNGHVELTPFVVGSGQLTRRWLWTGLVSWRSALGPDSPRSPGDPVAHGAALGPHSAQELAARLDLSWFQEGRWYASAGAEWVMMVAAPTRGPLVPRAELGWLPSAGFRLALGADATAWGESRHGLRGRLSAAWIF